MKKLKIMLLSFALLAVVGGALAFKAKLGTVNYCTTDVLSSPDFCKVSAALTTCPVPQTGTQSNSQGSFFCYTIDDDGTFDCKTPGGADLQCITTTTKIKLD